MFFLRGLCNFFIDYYSSSYSNSDENSDISSKEFVITFSVEEWYEIQPQVVRYKIKDPSRPIQSSKFVFNYFYLDFILIHKSGYNYKFRCYYALPKFNWTPVIAEHFWEHTRLKCCLSFRRAKVTPGGKYYVVIVGKCSTCQSHFKGVITERPNMNSRYISI